MSTLPLLSLFSVPKAFADHAGVIQGNAIQSWSRLGPNVEIILCGDEAGVGEAAAELGVRHVPDVRRSQHGTPLLDSVFRAASDAARSPLLGYVNTDIILFPDFLDAVKRLPTDHLTRKQREAAGTVRRLRRTVRLPGRRRCFRRCTPRMS